MNVYILEKINFDRYGYVSSACFAFDSFESANRSMLEDWRIEWEVTGCSGENVDCFSSAPFMLDKEARIIFVNEDRTYWIIHEAKREGD